MNFTKFLREEWVQALGCTEPASIAFAGMTAAKHLQGEPSSIKLIVDPKMYKNCYAAGIPHSGHKTGITWAAAIGAFLKNYEDGLICFRGIDDKVLKKAASLVKSNSVKIQIDRKKKDLHIDFTVFSENGKNARAVIEKTHTNLRSIHSSGKKVFSGKPVKCKTSNAGARKWAETLSPKKIIRLAKGISQSDRAILRNGAEMNLRIAKHGLSLFPKSFFELFRGEALTGISSIVCAGVYARMWGEDYPVMSISGSGNKGIVSTVPILLLEEKWKVPPRVIEEGLAISLLFTSKTTSSLGTLSAVCGCSNAAGIGLACAMVYIKGGSEKEISFAINNMVGNITGMICDGAKIGCALKTMTSVDAAFRAATLALSGIGIPEEDGIVGGDGTASLVNMGRIA
ncbi:MAG TPA: L-serine ammonia-lyase, iron-sulfur-dependent, subunit alpha, partial [bacterium]|nr:L-serine ammonia-lyase, iron-sulfur-dependent, subunit alpha [bacterium]